MSKPGPKRTPDEIKRRLGNPGKRALNDAAPQMPVGVPDPPEWLDQEARREWARIVPILQASGVLTLADRAVLTGYCVAWSEFHRAIILLQEHGRTMRTRTGYEAQRPEVAMAQKWLQRLESLAARLGLSPSDRSSIRVSTKDEPKGVLEELWSASAAGVADKPEG